ncbi:MAG: hypothetical protein ACLFPJ_06140, partial [Candidatus Woesearchaeota archaeon]
KDSHFSDLECDLDLSEKCFPTAQCYLNITDFVNSSKPLIYVYGGSSVVINDNTFSSIIQDKLDSGLIVNFGFCVADSFIIKEHIKNTINYYGKPDVVIIYSGHNDFTNFYHYINSFEYFYFFLEKISIFSGDDLWWQARLKRGPFLNKLQNLNLVKFNITKLDFMKDEILNRFIKNNDEIQNYLNDLKIPIIYLTTIGNLEAEPYGDISTTSYYYKKGLNEQNYLNRIKYLKKAMDSEMFTYDIRANSKLNDYIRSLDKIDEIYVLDLENELISRNFSFGFDDFTDYFHFTQNTHLLIADLLYNNTLKELLN